MVEEHSKFKIAVPTGSMGGLETEIYERFARAKTITLITVENNKITKVDVYENVYEGDIGQVGTNIADYLQRESVDVVLAYEVGGPLDTFLEKKGIEISTGYRGKVRDAIHQYLGSKGSMSLYTSDEK